MSESETDPPYYEIRLSVHMVDSKESGLKHQSATVTGDPEEVAELAAALARRSMLILSSKDPFDTITKELLKLDAHDKSGQDGK